MWKYFKVRVSLVHRKFEIKNGKNLKNILNLALVWKTAQNVKRQIMLNDHIQGRLKNPGAFSGCH